MGLLRRILPGAIVQKLIRHTRRPAVGKVDLGDLGRVKPLSQNWGYDRGKPIDRYYIERFLAGHSDDVRGRVLEIGSNDYTLRFGGDRVARSDVLHVAENAPNVTLIDDLAKGEKIPSQAFDCAIVTQTLQFIYDVPAALKTLHRILRPGGVALVTFPGVSKISGDDMARWGHYWAFTSRSAQRLFEDVFPAENLDIRSDGNVLTAIAFLHGLAAEELSAEQLDYRDPDYQVLISVRAEKPRASA